MLSIRLDAEREWWVSADAFDRLFDSALARGVMAQDLVRWRDIAHANGGLDLGLVEAPEAAGLIAGLRSGAEKDLALLGAEPGSHDETYRTSLQKLLTLTG